uniref:Nucleolus and neural progenitor protein-like N-terminal domain-containing protein n=1 Tax=Periophthalmus magnuspinnatus TaxID=409849 RepID=A0A3B4AYW4_9GOBI
MAEELWNRVNVPFPGAVSSVRIHFTSKTDGLVKNVVLVNETVLKLLDNESLQTEIRVLYELLYILNNSYRGNKSYKGLQQVEQCVNRLKNMKLVQALHELSDLCPTKVQRCQRFSWSLDMEKIGKFRANLMNRTLQRCSRAFLLCNQQMKWEEFVVLNMVTTSMLSRLWVIFRGVLVSMCTLYEKMLSLCNEVAKAKPMPFLKSPLPPNMTGLLDPGLLHNKTCKVDVGKHQIGLQKGDLLSRPNLSVKIVKEDLGVSIKRGKSHLDRKPKNNGIAAKMRILRSNVKKSSSFGDFDVHLEKMVQWCKLKQMGKKRRLFNYLRLKCQKLKCLESDGHKYESYHLYFFLCFYKVFKACSKSSVTRRTSGSLAEFKTKRQWTNFHSLRTKLKSKNVRTGSTRKREAKWKTSRKSKSSRHNKDADRRTEDEAISQGSHCDRRDDIDDIFASIGL